MCEKYLVKSKNMFWAFMDLGKVCDRTDREELHTFWDVMYSTRQKYATTPFCPTPLPRKEKKHQRNFFYLLSLILDQATLLPDNTAETSGKRKGKVVDSGSWYVVPRLPDSCLQPRNGADVLAL